MNLNNLVNLIHKLTEFGINPKVESENKILELKRLLVEIYANYLNSDSSKIIDGLKRMKKLKYLILITKTQEKL